jgi:hypothetical protein
MQHLVWLLQHYYDTLETFDCNIGNILKHKIATCLVSWRCSSSNHQSWKNGGRTRRKETSSAAHFLAAMLLLQSGASPPRGLALPLAGATRGSGGRPPGLERPRSIGFAPGVKAPPPQATLSPKHPLTIFDSRVLSFAIDVWTSCLRRLLTNVACST